MNWPKSLVTELASRRCIIFLGSGASAACLSDSHHKKPPTWEAFLKHLIALMRTNDDKPSVDECISKEKFLDAAEIIVNNISPADFSGFIREEFIAPRYKASKMHECVLELDPKIVLTTNYDNIYDTYCMQGNAHDGYNVSKYYEDHIISDLRSPVRLIIKSHGCVSDTSKIVLTKSQYFKARQDYSGFYKILDALFLTHTILFLGYSLSDPDIQLTLENVNITSPSNHPHYFVTGNTLNRAIKEANKKSYNIEFIEFENGNYDELNTGLHELVAEVKLLREMNPTAS